MRKPQPSQTPGGWRVRTDGGHDELPTARIQTALSQLAEARRYAEDAARPVWDFAVEIHTLDLTPNDLRWLVCKGYVEHAQETTRRADDGRTYRPAGKLTFTRRSCFVLTQAGLLLPHMHIKITGANGQVGVQPAESLSSARHNGKSRLAPLLPHWDRDRRELWLGAKLVKQFRLPSRNQETILAAFEEEGWPPSIDDPLSPHPEQDTKRRLHETIRSLNRHQKHRLLRFQGDGTGQRVLWERLFQRSRS